MRTPAMTLLGLGAMLSAPVLVIACGSDDASTRSSSSSGEGASSSGGNGTPPANGSSSGATPAPGSCGMSAKRARVTEIDVGAEIVQNQDESALRPVVIAPAGAIGSRVAWMGKDGKVHVTTLDGEDRVTGNSLAFDANDFSDMIADDAGGALLLTRAKDCGASSALCGTPPNPPIPCYGMFLVRFDTTGKEVWATELTNEVTPYSNGANFIWWYAHHGRIAWSGTQYAAHFGTALSVANGSCIDIHQGDRQRVIDANGAIQTGGWEWGCSHSGYERVIWDAKANRFASVCKTDNQNRIMFNVTSEVRKVDLWYSNVGNLVAAPDGYWLTSSDVEPGQPANADGHADVHLLHFQPGNGNAKATVDRDIVVAGMPNVNERAPHLAGYGADRLLAAWETSSTTGELAPSDRGRKLHVQTRSMSTGEAEGEALEVDVRGNRWLDFRSFPDGSVAFPAPGSTSSRLAILRILPCTAP